ncbi:replication initiator protein [Blackfly microvirus SF02]|uniref:Replication initiator protein n=1 Tax=Blackfly microvirus SF02 TaxID=2576452 RepID=A0A4P8PK00_9VIRU|nr:replication initiator protein [Blackfly microvirus SF02]
MQCFYASTGYFSKDVNPLSGRRPVVFDKRKSFSGIPLTLPCGKCIGCRMNWRRQWAVRCMHEKRMHDLSAFVTLTYGDAHLPHLCSLRLEDLQRFMKRLRKVRPTGLRFFACGEYGETLRRPHYHVLLFNTDFPDMRYHKDSRGSPLYRSAELSWLWPYGDHEIAAVTARSAAYVAGYVMKKAGSEPSHLFGQEPEFRVMSRRPGLGYSWFMKYAEEAYRHDSAIMDGKEVGLPRYYDTLYERVNGVGSLKLTKRERRREMFKFDPADQSQARLLVRERFEILKLARFKRDATDG